MCMLVIVNWNVLLCARLYNSGVYQTVPTGYFLFTYDLVLTIILQHSLYVPNSTGGNDSPSGKHPFSGDHTRQPLSGLKALFASPLNVKNPFSPLFAPHSAASHSTDNGNNNHNYHQPDGIHSLEGQNNGRPATPGQDNNNNNINSGDMDAPPLQITFCGHSLGAAIASLAAFDLSENIKPIMEAFAMEDCFNVPKSQGLYLYLYIFVVESSLRFFFQYHYNNNCLGVSKLPAFFACPAPQLSLYMYGSPRVGNALFARSIAKKVDNIYRVQVNGDVVTMMPKFIGFYRHMGEF